MIPGLHAIQGELMAPARQIESIKVLDVKAGAGLPLVKELRDFAKADPGAMLKKVAEHVPALREAMGPKG